MIRLLTYLLGILLISCSSGKKPVNTIITATLRGPSAMSMIKMIDQRPSTGGLKTDFIISNEPNHVRSMIIAGDVDFAVLPTTTAALLYNKDQPYVLAAIPVWGTLYLFGTDTSIHAWNDLRGKKVSLMGRGMTPDVLFRFLAEKNGLDPDRDMQLDYSFSTHIELSNAIISGNSDLGVISEPLVTQVSAKNPEVVPLIDLNTEWEKVFGGTVPFAQTALLVRKELVGKSPQLVNDYLNLLRESIAWVNENPVEASVLIVKHEIMDDTLLARRAIPRCNLRYAPAYEEMEGIQEYLKVFFNFNPLIIGEKLPDEKFYYKE